MTLPLDEFDFEFPQELVASEPAEPRDSSRMLVVDRAGGGLLHKRFRDLPEFLSPGDCVVLNRTKVRPCRLAGKKETGGRAEILLVREVEPGLWAGLASGLKRGKRIIFPGGASAVVEGLTDDGEYLCRFDREDLRGYLESHGTAPLPPYILKRKTPGANDLSRYQTVYAREPGSIAAPTAGLHFTGSLLETLRRRGVRVVELTLHVGRGTFKPIETADAAEHRMLPEWYRLAEEQARAISAAMDEGRRVVSVGTTSTRTLETLARSGHVGPGEGWTDLYIRPGHEFKAVSALITNFHLPKSTPMLLASAFLGLGRLKAAYEEAIRERYRLYSYGDAMLIL